MIRSKKKILNNLSIQSGGEPDVEKATVRTFRYSGGLGGCRNATVAPRGQVEAVTASRAASRSI